jgi:RNA polymerase sigma factor (sigma-70 family)
MNSTVSDEALLAGLAAGQPEAAAAFIRRFQSRVYGLAITIVRDEGIAEDVAQETFTRAWRHGASYDARRGRVVTWLLSIARNLAIDVVRMKRAEPRDPDFVEGRLQLGAPAGGPADAGAPVDERERLRGALRDLPDEQRRALFLASFLGRTAREISELDDVPLGTVKTRIRAGMMKLHETLEGSHEV